MRSETQLDILLADPHLAPELKNIAQKVKNSERITFDEGVLLFEKGELGYLGTLANYIREKKNGDYTYFNRNFHIEPTNLCVYDCKFCSYSRLIKQRSEGWEFTMDEMFDMVKNTMVSMLQRFILLEVYYHSMISNSILNYLAK